MGRLMTLPTIDDNLTTAFAISVAVKPDHGGLKSSASLPCAFKNE